MSAPTTRRRAVTVERLLDAALETFADTGFAAASVEDVCRRGGFTRGAFYSSFSTKHELFAALMTRETARDLAAAEQLVAEVSGAADPLVAAVDRVADLLAAGRTWTLVHTEYQLLAARDTDAAALLDRFAEGMATQVAEVLERAADTLGVTLTLPATDVAHAFLALHHGLALASARTPGARTGALERTAFLALVRGVTAPSTAPTP
ncbi:TetR/AcrR family transcriptional regulator [Klenkia sp. PcliD-1-E]|uniref:TetR/AcrR family transcriptional regulator n=1 Tax=Klenkia sp. PcliD-1-E TaxID=2954492 RepID=UPI0020983B13|nr:TetR/AcrR family transcriptional regulator [Klenkia sp. PcliD-1-E]MCO7219430.1 TetR/AcrR family transcriptional regulator [Klenkia sp. PcliD-1-E]